MSEEEIIKYLKNVIKTIQESDMLFDEPANIRCGIKMKGALQGLLDLYNKEKEKNKKAKRYILEKQSIQYKYALSQIECEELLNILEE